MCMQVRAVAKVVDCGSGSGYYGFAWGLTRRFMGYGGRGGEEPSRKGSKERGEGGRKSVGKNGSKSWVATSTENHG